MGLLGGAVVAWLVGWTSHDAVAGAGGDWAATIRNAAGWAGDASKVALGALIGGAAGVAAGWMNRRTAREDRIRNHRIEQIRQTEEQVSTVLGGMKHVVLSSSSLMLAWHVRGFQQKLESLFQADEELIGEIDAVVALVQAFVPIAQKMPTAPWVPPPFRSVWLGLVLLVRNPWDTSDAQALDTARRECLAALRRQEERALRDEPLAKLDPEELRKRVNVPELEALLARGQ